MTGAHRNGLCGAILALVGLWANPATAAPPARPDAVLAQAKISPWEPIFVGVQKCQATATKPRPLQIRAVRVDLREPTVSFLVTPSNGPQKLDCAARKTGEFLTEFKCQVAINGSAYAPRAGATGEPVDVMGLSLSRGKLYSRPTNKFDALLISRSGKAWIDRAPIDAGRAYHGLSGFYALLIDGKNLGDMKQRAPRSAVGISRDGRYLILMTIDGRQTGVSEGTTTAETAEWLRKLGAYHGLNLDGGGSTTLCVEGPQGQPIVLNRPSGFFQRRVGNHLGVFARPLPSKPASPEKDREKTSVTRQSEPPAR